MKKTLLLIFSLSLFSFIDYNSCFNNSTYFEGHLTYEINYTPYNENINSEQLKELIGSKMILTFKKGNYKKEYFSTSGKLLQERILNIKEEKMYLKTADSDTIYWVNITKNDSETTFEILKDSTILNHPCTIIKTKTTVSRLSSNEKSVEIEGLLTYAKDLPVNPNWYTNFREGNFNEIVKAGKGIVIESINRGFYREQKIKVKSVTKRNVKKSELKIKLDSKTPLKEL